MNIDLPHTIATAVLIFGTLLAIKRMSFYQNGSRLKRSVVFGVAVFIVVFVLDLIWPYGKMPVFSAS
jgi:hypothetical protein